MDLDFLTQIPLNFKNLGILGIIIAFLMSIIKSLINVIILSLQNKINKNNTSNTVEICSKSNIDKLLEKCNNNKQIIQSIYDCHLGNTAVDRQGRPRWYIPEYLMEDINTIKRNVEDLKKELQEIKQQLL